MKVTETELTDLLNKVYEGAGLAYGDYQDCARAIVWCVMHGVVSLDELDGVLLDWEVSGCNPAGIHHHNPQTTTIQAHNNPGLLYSGLALNLAVHLAQIHGQGKVVLLNAPYPFFALAHLSLAAKEGIDCQILWENGVEQAELASIKLTETIPTVNFPIPMSFVERLTIVCKQIQGVEPRKNPLSEQYYFHSQNGVEVSEGVWAKLVKLSKKVLVPATKKSRLRGAGEQS